MRKYGSTRLQRHEGILHECRYNRTVMLRLTVSNLYNRTSDAIDEVSHKPMSL